MYYVIRSRTLSTWAVTNDGRVAQAGSALDTFKGKKIGEVLKWARQEKLSVFTGESDRSELRRLE